MDRVPRTRSFLSVMVLGLVSVAAVSMLAVGAALAHLPGLSGAIDRRYADGALAVLNRLARPLDVLERGQPTGPVPDDWLESGGNAENR